MFIIYLVIILIVIGYDGNDIGIEVQQILIILCFNYEIFDFDNFCYYL